MASPPRDSPSSAPFVGRQAELELLSRAYGSRESAFIPIYGRRRIGKSELILRFIRDKPAIYYLGKTAPAGVQLREFLGEAARVLDEPLLAEMPAEDWKQRLITLEERWPRTQKLVLVFDEFQWVAAASPEIPSVLQELWDPRWRRSGKVMLILCGSYVGFMERAVLGAKSPLFGRRTAQIFLQPFDYREAALFHPSWSLADRARAYFICGGVPLYLRAFDVSRSIEQNIEANLLDEFAPLFREPDFLLREELREVESYYAVLLAIAKGKATPREIAGEAGLPERSLHYYLQQLRELGYVGRRHPLTDPRRTQRKVRFAVEDALLRFWFRFVFPNMSFIQQMGARRAYQARVRPELEGYFGGCFERLCREGLRHLYEREGVRSAFETGEYWDRDAQIDVVGLRQDHRTDLGECRWGRVTSIPKLRAELEAKVNCYPNRRGATIGKRFFLRELPRTSLPMEPLISWHDLADVYR